MRIERADPNVDKGWLAGRWNSELDFSIGYANTGVNEPHVHAKVTEIYLVARGTAEIRGPGTSARSTNWCTATRGLPLSADGESNCSGCRTCRRGPLGFACTFGRIAISF
jgi:hypothetical protein